MKLDAIANPLIHLRNNQFLRHIALLGSGTAVAQLANILATPILAVLYEPASFGMMVIYMGIVVVIGTMASLTYESAIILPRSEGEALSLLQLCLVLTLSTAFLVLLALTFFYLIFDKIGFLSHWSLVVLIPLGIFSLGSLNAGSQWSIRHDLFKAVSLASIIRSASALVVQLLIGVFSATSIGLVLGRIIGQCAASAYVLFSGRLSAGNLVPNSFGSLRDAASLHFRFPLFKAPQSIIVLLSDQMPAFALATSFGPASAGLYWMADRILTLPSTVISEATAKTFYSECVKRRQKQVSIKPLFLSTTACLSLAACVPAIFIFIYAPALFGLLGDEWGLSGNYARWLIVWAFF